MRSPTLNPPSPESSIAHAPAALVRLDSPDLMLASEAVQQSLGRPISPVTLWRWIRRGRCDCRLEALSVAGQWHTTPAAVAEFIRATTAAILRSNAPPDGAPRQRTGGRKSGQCAGKQKRKHRRPAPVAGPA